MLIASAAEETKVDNTMRNFVGNMLAGGIAGAGVESVLFPLDTIKTRLQASSGAPIQWAGLYKGLAGNICGAFPSSMVFFGVYEPVKQHLERHFPDNLFLAHFAAAASANLGASVIRVPTEVVKQRMQTGQFNSAKQAVMSIARREGARGLYAGYGAFMLRDLPFDVIEFVGYEQMKATYRSFHGGRELNSGEVAVIGGAAGVATGALTTPFDVIKTRLMTQGTTKQYNNLFDCGYKLVTQEGAGALFKGVQPRVTWIGLGGCIFFSTLEAAKSALTVPDSPK